MSSNNSLSDAGSRSPLLGSGGHEEEGEAKAGWWKRILDVEAAKNQVLFSLPITITNLSYYLIPLVSVMFAGHLGELQFAGSNLAHSWSTVTGLTFMIGLSGALEALCGQGYGANLHRMLGIYLQSSCIISFCFSIIISIFWFCTKPILIFLHQDPAISETAGLYMKYLIPAIFAYGFLHNFLRFFQTQNVVMPLVVGSVIPLTIHLGITYVLVHCTPLALKGAALAVSISLRISVIMLAIYVLYSKKFKHTWNGFSLESFHYILTNLKLALPSAAMVCFEYWAFELLVLLAGVMPNSEITTSLIAMCVNTEASAYMITYGLSAAASTIVSNELGAGNPHRAKHAMAVTLKLSILLVLMVVSALGFGHDIWAGFFSDSSIIIQEYASMTPLLVISILFDTFQSILSGVARGCGWQHMVVVINLATYYLIGMPLAGFLGFKLKLYAKGLWMGLICGISCQAFTLFFLTQLSKWNRLELSAKSNKQNPNLV